MSEDETANALAEAHRRLEALERRLQVEEALDRVRARALAMRQSDELASVAAVMLREEQALGIESLRSGIGIITQDEDKANVWTASTSADGGDDLQLTFHIPLKGHPTVEGLHAAWKRQDDWYLLDLSGDDLTAYAQFMKARLAGPFPEDPSFDASAVRRVVFHFFPFPEGAVSAITAEPLPEAVLRELRRLADAFAFAYTRYLDLKQAEEQAREAQIEAALERVRARSMAMRRSDELSEVAGVVFEQFEGLGLDPVYAGVAIIEEEAGYADLWLTAFGGVVNPILIQVPLTGHPQVEKNMVAWRRGDPFLSWVVEGKEAVQAQAEAYAAFTGDPHFLSAVPAERQEHLEACHTYGTLSMVSYESIPAETGAILQRFAHVFEQTYTRFLDLKKAEEQAREAVRQASIDRIRAEIASMRTADDLERITPLVWRELTTLGVPFFRCGVFIMDEAAEIIHAYLSTPAGESRAVLRLPFDSIDTTRDAVDHWRRKAVYGDLWDRDRFVVWMGTILEQGLIDEQTDFQGLNEPPEQLALQFVPFTQGMLYVGSADPLAEDQIDLVQALADAFAVAYARYEDFKRLEVAKADVEATLDHLKTTQAQLIQAEKMASLGQLTAGIAHEIKNPLNFVNNFAQLSTELTDEITEELDAHADKTVAEIRDDLDELLTDLRFNSQKINEHGKRADAIVRAMMDHARGGERERRALDVNALLEEYVNLAYHGMRANTPDFNVTLERDFDETVGKVEMVPQEIGRVFINLLNNAFYAVHQKAAAIDGAYAPTVAVSTQRTGEVVEIRIRDNGPGIKQAVREKIFEPFYTTKPTGEGTGLGLSLSYDIVTQGHGGAMTVESEEGEGAAFIVCLPVPLAS